MAKAAVLFGLSWLAQSALAKDVHLSWNITWVNAAPNGYSRPVIGINGEWPCPQVDVDLGDRLIVDVYNGLGNQTTGIHWHGFRQYMTGTMDGSSDVTQCPLAPGSRMTYDFMVRLPFLDEKTRRLTRGRRTKQGHIGTTRITWVNTPTVFAVL